MTTFLKKLGFLAAITLLSSCATTSQRDSSDWTTTSSDEEKTAVLARSVVNPERDRSMTPVAGDEADKDGDSGIGFVQKGSGELINLEAASKPRRPVPADGDITFNFEGAGIPEVVKVILGDLLQENYVIAPGVGGQVTFSTSKPVNSNQAMGILEMLLSWNNATLIFQEGRYVVVPTANAVQGNLAPRVGSPMSVRGYEVRAIPLSFISATEMEKLLQPYARPGAVLRADDQRALIVLAGTRAELQSYADTIEVFDVDWLAGMSIGMFPLEVVEADDMVTELEGVFSSDEGSPLAGLVKFQAIERLNAIMVITPNARYLDQVEGWIERLDRAGNDAGARLFVFDVKNVNALDLADRLNDIFGSEGGRLGNSSSAAGEVALGLGRVELQSSSGRGLNNSSINNTRGTQRFNTGTGVGGAPLAQEGGGNAAAASAAAPAVTSDGQQGLVLFDAEDVRITAVEENNQLLIRSTPAQYETIRSAIERLDTVPLQVHIEAKILDVTLNDSLKYGVDWYLSGALNTIGVPSTDGETTAATSFLGLPPQGTNPNARLFNFGSTAGQLVAGEGGSALTWLFDARDARALVNLLATESEVKVLSSPSLLVLNNKQASINVGQQIPVNSSFINTGVGAGQTNTVVQFRDTGITLNVVPRVNPGGLVFMEIQQEQSDPGDLSGNATNPPINQKVLQTEVAVQSGQTVLLGGLIRQTDGGGSSGLPGLSRIPFFGALFGNQSKSVNRSELVVLITPTVIRNQDEAAELTLEYQKRLRGLEPLLREQLEQERARQAARSALGSDPAEGGE